MGQSGIEFGYEERIVTEALMDEEVSVDNAWCFNQAPYLIILILIIDLHGKTSIWELDCQWKYGGKFPRYRHDFGQVERAENL